MKETISGQCSREYVTCAVWTCRSRVVDAGAECARVPHGEHAARLGAHLRGRLGALARRAAPRARRRRAPVALVQPHVEHAPLRRPLRRPHQQSLLQSLREPLRTPRLSCLTHPVLHSYESIASAPASPFPPPLHSTPLHSTTFRSDQFRSRAHAGCWRERQPRVARARVRAAQRRRGVLALRCPQYIFRCVSFAALLPLPLHC